VRTLGVARGTIRQAMVSLENDGLIRRVQGKATSSKLMPSRTETWLDIFALVVPETRWSLYASLLHGFELPPAISVIRRSFAILTTTWRGRAILYCN